MKRTGFSKRRTGLKRGKGPKKSTKSLKRGSAARKRSFSERYPKDHNGPRYGKLFRAVRRQPCWLLEARYRGPKHERCGPGAQGGHTAHHLGREDAAGMIPGCGLAHDLYANIAGRIPQQEFDAWLEQRGETLEQAGLRYVASVSP